MRSMTGFGKALCRDDDVAVEVEVRSVNNRYLKTQFRSNRPMPGVETEVESIVREFVERGTVSLSVRIERQKSSASLRLDRNGLARLIEDSREAAQALGLDAPRALEAYMSIPGIVVAEDNAEDDDAEVVAILMRRGVREALEGLVAMRDEEGQRLAKELHGVAERLSAGLTLVTERAPQVVEAYRTKLRSRLDTWLEEKGVQVETKDLLKEVALFTDRADISEEIQRLSSHLETLSSLLDATPVGRKLEFLLQEMLRETNTIGSKASDLEIAQAVVDMKSELEKLREQAQNVE